MSLPDKVTLGELRVELQARLGYAAATSVSTVNSALLNSFLRRAQDQLYWEYHFPELYREFGLRATAPSAWAAATAYAVGDVVKPSSQSGSLGLTAICTVAGTSDAAEPTWGYVEGETVTDNSVTWEMQNAGRIEWPDLCEPRKIRKVSALVDGTWMPLKRGIEISHDSVAQPTNFPKRWDDTYGKLEIWPMPDQTYPIKIEGYKRLGSFTQDKDEVTLDDYPVLLLALINAKAHYRHQDAEAYVNQLQVYLGKLKAADKQGKRFYAGPKPNEDPLPQPRTV